MKIAIMGSGAIGGYYGAMLQNGGADVTFIARGATLNALRQNGVAARRREAAQSAEGEGDRRSRDHRQGRHGDLLGEAARYRKRGAPAFCPSSARTPASSRCRTASPRTTCWRPIVGREHLLGGAAYIGVSVVRPGVIRKAGTMERLAFGEFDNKVSKRAQAFLDACKASDIKADIPADISLELWQKFVVIVTMSSITSAMRSTIGPIRANPHARQFALDVMKEVVAVGRARGVALEPDFAEKRVRPHRWHVARHARLDVARPGAWAAARIAVARRRGGRYGRQGRRADAVLPRGARHSRALCGREGGLTLPVARKPVARMERSEMRVSRP